MRGFRITLNRRHFDTVYFDKNMTCAEVKLAMVKEGLPSNITVRSVFL